MNGHHHLSHECKLNANEIMARNGQPTQIIKMRTNSETGHSVFITPVLVYPKENRHIFRSYSELSLRHGEGPNWVPELDSSLGASNVITRLIHFRFPTQVHRDDYFKKCSVDSCANVLILL